MTIYYRFVPDRFGGPFDEYQQEERDSGLPDGEGWKVVPDDCFGADGEPDTYKLRKLER